MNGNQFREVALTQELKRFRRNHHRFVSQDPMPLNFAPFEFNGGDFGGF
jgi:hypothetical protein